MSFGKNYRLFKGSYCLHLRSLPVHIFVVYVTEYKVTTILRNFCNCLRIRTVWDSTRFDSSASPLWEFQIASYHCFSLLTTFVLGASAATESWPSETVMVPLKRSVWSCDRSYNPIRTLTSSNCRIVGFIFVEFIKTTLDAEARLKIAEILLRLDTNKRGLTLQGETNKDLFTAKNISKQGLALRSTGLNNLLLYSVHS